MATVTNIKQVTLLNRPTEAVEHFQISHMTLFRWRKQDGFPQPLKRGNVVLYDIAAIESWLAQGASHDA